MGLLDFNYEDPKSMGLLALAQGLFKAGAPQTRRVGLGEALSGGLGNMVQAQQQARDQQMKTQNDMMVLEMNRMQLDQNKSNILAKQKAAEFQARIPQIVQSFGKDYAGMRLAGVPQDLIEFIAKSGDLGMPEVARTIDTEGPNGEKITVSYDKQGRVVGQGVNSYVAPVSTNLGDRVVFNKPMAGQSLPMGRSPDSVATNNLQREKFNYEKTRDAQNQNKPTFSAELGGFVSPDGGFKPVAGMPKKSEKMTEDQSKATGWLVQAENAWKNMQSAGTKGKDANGNFIVTDAAKPGFNDVLSAVPSFGLTGGIANTLRGADRQKFMQSASSLSEALLRAATGAGVNKDEAAQKIAELTPQIGDSEDVTQQKLNAIPTYIESLKVRSGAGANKAYDILQNQGKNSGGWSITKVN